MEFLSFLPQRLDSGATPTFAGILTGDGSAAAPAWSFLNDSDTGVYRPASGEIGFTSNGNATFRMVSTGVASFLTNVTSQGTYLSLANSGAVTIGAGGTNQSITLTPSGNAFGVLSSGSSSFPSTFNLQRATVAGGAYVWSNQGANAEISAGFYYNGTNFVYAASASAVSGLGFGNTNSGDIQFLQAAAGTAGNTFTPTVVAMFKEGNGRFLLNTTIDSGALLQVGTNTTSASGNGVIIGTDCQFWRIASGVVQTGFDWRVQGNLNLGSQTVNSISGSLVLASNNVTALTLDSSQNAFFGARIQIPSGNGYYWGSRSIMSSPADGVILFYNNAGTDFSRLQFGGTTSSFGAISRVGAGLGVVLADNSAYANLSLGNAILKNAAGNGGASEVVLGNTTQTTVGAAGGASALPATPTGFLKFKIASTDYAIPYYAAA